MASQRVRWFLWALLGVVFIMSAIYGSLAWSKGAPAVDHPVFQHNNSRPMVIAHRGGAGISPENTLFAFKRAADLGVDVIETDVHATSDGVLVVIHDANVERTTDGSGLVSEMTFEDLKKLDAGYRFSPDGGKTFPFRQSGITVPTLLEVFTALPKMKFNIEPKQQTPSLVKPLCQMLRERKMTNSVIIGSFNQTILEEFRVDCAEAATSAGPGEVSKFLSLYKTGLSATYSPSMSALQIPESVAGLQIVTKDFIDAAHERNLKVHVWTVNETKAMKPLLEMGVDGIMTDYPDRLQSLLREKAAAR
ncbi:MAG: glycerophosphodiester phosphodiesterase [Acidobacteria bacterium]|nr:glycerophosphodiester phosphodiesterase [Acidobacteriota bacterium]